MEYSKTSLRTGALTDRVKRKAVREFYRPFAERYPSVRNPFTPVRRVAMFIGGGAGLVGALTMVFGITYEVSRGGPDGDGELVPMIAICLLLLGAGIVLVWFFRRTSAQRGTPKRHYRLARFAADNGLSYEPGPVTGTHVKPWAERGVLTLTRVMRPVSERSIEFANYELRAGATGSGNAQFGGFCAVRLSTRLPHIVLKAQGGPADTFTMASLPDSTQRLSLEVDFDDHFTLYCPTGYERDALYLFTPDVMARLIDRVRGFDVEIIDDWLFLVSSRDLVTLNPRTWQGLFDAVNALSDKIGRWERWRDDRHASVPRVVPSAEAVAQNAAGLIARGVKPSPAGSRRVARPGRRLRMRLGAGELIGIVALALLLAGGVVSLFF
ncbi:hypothetical protein [Cryobacterium sp. AP23]